METTAAEKDVVRDAIEGRETRFDDGDDSSRTLRGEFLASLCRGSWDGTPLDPRGLTITGARVEGEFVLDWQTITIPLRFQGCVFTQVISLVGSTIRLLSLEGSSLLQGIRADRLTAREGVQLRNGFKSMGALRFLRASIEHDLDLSASELENEKLSLFADGLRVGGSVLLRSSRIVGEVRLQQAVIANDLDLDRSSAKGAQAALNIDGAKIGRNFFARDCQLSGEVRLLGASIAGNFECAASRFSNLAGDALTLDGAKVGGDVDLQESHIEGAIRLVGSKLGRGLNLFKAEVVTPVVGEGSSAPQKSSINAEAATVDGSVFLVESRNRGCVHFRSARIRGSFVAERCNFESQSERTLRLDNANIGGDVYFSGGQLRGTSSLEGCSVLGGVHCPNAAFLANCGASVLANSIRVSGGVFLSEGFRAAGEFQLMRARIDGGVHCREGSFSNAPKDGKPPEDGTPALSLDGAEVQGGLFLSYGFRSNGEVSLAGLKLGGNLELPGATLSSPGGCALSLEGATVTGTAFLGKIEELQKGARFTGLVRLAGFSCTGDLVCSGAAFDNPAAFSIDGTNVRVTGDVHLDDGFAAHGEVLLLGAAVGGSLLCDDGSFTAPQGRPQEGAPPEPHALSLDGASFGRSIFLRRRFKADGEVRLVGCDVRGQLDCSGGTFSAPEETALNAQDAVIGRGVFLSEGFRATGSVALTAARISGSVDCTNGSFDCGSQKFAFALDGSTIEGSLLLRDGFASNGAVRLPSCRIKGDLDCGSGSFVATPNSAQALAAPRCDIAGSFFWKPIEFVGQLVLNDARIGVLIDDERTWPKPGELVLDGLAYGSFGTTAPRDAKARLRWIGLQSPGQYRAQPFEQLVSVLRKTGYGTEAKQVSIAKRRARRKLTTMGFGARAWECVYDLTMAFGYKPLRPVVFVGLIAIITGAVVFQHAASVGQMAPTHESIYLKTEYSNAKHEDPSAVPDMPPEYPQFSPIAYSIDALVPLLDLHQEAYWLPIDHLKFGYRAYLWIHIAIGWILTTWFVVAVTGLVKKDG